MRSIIHFLLMGIALSAAFSSSPLYAVITSNVNVSAGDTKAVMPWEGLGMGTAPYYNNTNQALTDERLEDAGVTTLRIGGGGYADIYHWSITRSGNGIVGNGRSPWWGEAGNFEGHVGAGGDFASFVNLMDRTDNSRAVVTVNYGSALKLVGGQSQVPDFGGQPKEAAAWVAYSNSDASIFGTENDIVIGVDQQGNDWKTAGYWAKLRASTQTEYEDWATDPDDDPETNDSVYEPLNRFLALNRDEPIGIKYWEIGNETFGTGYYGGGTGYSVDYDLAYGTNRDDHVNLSPGSSATHGYGQEVVQYSQLMKSIDPTIKIGAVLATPPDDYGWSYADLNDNGSKGATEPYWNDEVLDEAADDIDFVMVHWYPYVGETYTDSNGNETHDVGEPVNNGTSLLNFPAQKINRMINGTTAGPDTGTNAGIRDTLAAHGIPDAEIMVTEFGYFGEVWGGGVNNLTNYRTPAQSLFVADSYASWLELGVTSVQYLEMMTKQFLFDNGSLTRGPAYYAISMIDRMAEPGDEFVDATSSNASVRVHATVQDDGNVAVMILNNHVSETADVTINIDDLMLESDGTRYTLTSGTTMSGPTPASGLGNSFMASVGPRSISTFIIPISVPDSLIGDYNNDGKVSAADYTVWRDSVGAESLQNRDPDNVGPVDLDDYDSWIAHYGETFGHGSGSAILAGSVPEPSSLVLACLALVALAARFRAMPRMA